MFPARILQPDDAPLDLNRDVLMRSLIRQLSGPQKEFRMYSLART
jgi:hypothetical protein